MRILFDQGVPRNGELLRLAEDAGFELMVTTGKNVRYRSHDCPFGSANGRGCVLQQQSLQRSRRCQRWMFRLNEIFA